MQKGSLRTVEKVLDGARVIRHDFVTMRFERLGPEGRRALLVWEPPMTTMHTERQTLPPLPQFVGARDVRRMLGGACNSTLNKLIRDGILPTPIRPRKNMMLFEYGALLQAVQRMSA